MSEFIPTTDIDNIEVRDSVPLFDARKFEGKRVKIDKVYQDVIDSHYVNGVYEKNMTVKQPVIIVETEVVETIKLGEGDVDIRVKERFALQTANDGRVVISKNPKAKLWRFMRKMGATKPSELKGRIVTLTTEPSKDENDDRVFLKIVI